MQKLSTPTPPARIKTAIARPTRLRTILKLGKSGTPGITYKRARIRPAAGSRISSATTMGWCTIFDALLDKPQNTIAKWDLSGQGINLEISKSLAAYMAVSGSLTSINLSANSLGPESAKLIAKAISESGSLTSIDVGFNQITGDAAQQLATVVLDKPNLESFCNIPLKELRADSLSELDLGEGVGVPGALVVAHFLRVSNSLTEINLRRNDLGPEGAKALGPAIAVSQSLTSIYLLPTADACAACRLLPY